MATLNAVILPAKALKGGKHKIRISVAHNGETRYIVTDIIIDSDKEFKNGTVIKRPDAAMKNTKIRTELQKYQDVIDELQYIDGLTCAELISQMKSTGNQKHRTLLSIYQEYLGNATCKPATQRLYATRWKYISECINGKMLVEHITHSTILSLDKSLKEKKLRPGIIRNYMTFFRALLSYATRCGYVQFRADPFFGYVTPKAEIRDSWLSVDEIRMIRDFKSDNYRLTKCRDLFMLSYYLGGINASDLVWIDFRENATSIRYERKKTNRCNKQNRYVEFVISDEAKEIINRYMAKDGRLDLSDKQRKRSLSDLFGKHLPKIASALGIKTLIYYSARKSFSQHAFNLGVPTCVIDYILGHSIDKGGTSLYSYISVIPEMATKAIRQVLDNLK